MKSMKHIGIAPVFIFSSFALLQQSILTEVSAMYIPNVSQLQQESSISNITTNPTTVVEKVNSLDALEFPSTNNTQADATNEFNITSSLEDTLKNLLFPFSEFPFFPFHFPKLKREILNLNSSNSAPDLVINENGHVTAGNRSARKPKPFVFIDFAFKIQEIPLKNHTNELISTPIKRNDEIQKIPLRKIDEKYTPFDFLGDSSFDDSPFLFPDMDEFLPKSEFLFDFPFHKRQGRNQIRNKRDMMKPGMKNGFNFIIDMFDEALSRTKKEIDTDIAEEGQLFSGKTGRGLKNDQKLEKEKRWIDKNRTKGIKRSAYGADRHSNPVILGKVLKIDEIHFNDDFSKSKKKRRVTDKKGNRGIQEASIEVIEMNQPLKSDFVPKHFDMSPFHTSLKDVFHKIHEEKENKDSHAGKFGHKMSGLEISELLNQWERRDMEEREKANTKDNEGVSYTKAYTELNSEKGFKYVDRKENRVPARDGVGFEILKPQSSFPRSKRQEGGTRIRENSSASPTTVPSKEEVSNNITHVLGQFFSMMKKLGETKSFYQDKDGSEFDNVKWIELEEPRGSTLKSSMKRSRRQQETDEEDDENSSQVADLTHLFLTVTLPTVLAFTLLVVVCFFSFRTKGWVCKKLFKPRHVYVVEGDAEKGEKNKMQTTLASLNHQATDDAKFHKQHEKEEAQKNIREADIDGKIEGDDRTGESYEPEKNKKTKKSAVS